MRALTRTLSLLAVWGIVAPIAWAELPAQRPADLLVIDEGGLLGHDEKAEMTRQLEAVFKDLDIEVVVATTTSMGGTDIVIYGNILFNRWRIGSRTKGNRGVLFLVAVAEEQVRCEVSYGLEDVFPDAFISYIEQRQMASYFEHAMLNPGIQAAVEMLVTRAYEGSQGKAYVPEPLASSPPDIGGFVSGGAGADAPVAITNPTPPVPARVGESLAEHFGAQPTPELAWQRFLEVQQRHIKDTEIDLYNEPAKVILRTVPNTDAGQDRLVQMYEGQAATIRQQGDRAAVLFLADQTQRLAPWFFRKGPPGWQFDGSMFPFTVGYDYEGRWWFSTLEHPYMFAFRDFTFDDQRRGTYVPGSAPPDSSPVASAESVPSSHSLNVLMEQLGSWLSRGDYDKVEAMIREAQAQQDWDRVFDLYACMIEVFGVKPWLDHWVQQSPDSAIALTAHGWFYTNYAWEARGTGLGSEVTREEGNLMKNRLAVAKADLERAAQLDPSDPTIPGRLIRVAIGLGLNRNYMEQQFQRAVQVAPFQYHVHAAKLKYLTPKWYGTKEEAVQFAQNAVVRAPADSRLKLLIADLSIELYNSDRITKNDKEWNEIQQAFERYLAAHPDDLRIRNMFAQHAFWGGRVRVAAEQFRLIGQEWDRPTWKTHLEFERAKIQIQQFEQQGYP